MSLSFNLMRALFTISLNLVKSVYLILVSVTCHVTNLNSRSTYWLFPELSTASHNLFFEWNWLRKRKKRKSCGWKHPQWRLSQDYLVTLLFSRSGVNLFVRGVWQQISVDLHSESADDTEIRVLDLSRDTAPKALHLMSNRAHLLDMKRSQTVSITMTGESTTSPREHCCKEQPIRGVPDCGNRAFWIWHVWFHSSGWTVTTASGYCSI